MHLNCDYYSNICPFLFNLFYLIFEFLKTIFFNYYCFLLLSLKIKQICLIRTNQQSKKMLNQYQETLNQSRQLSKRMRMGTGVSTLLHQPDPSTHYMDSLERFQKDFAQHDKVKRQQELQKRNQQIEKRRISMLQRQSRRWQLMEEFERKLKTRQQESTRMQNSGIRRSANLNSLPFNPINLQYASNPQGERLRLYDEQQKIRSYVRAHNMDSKGNCNYNVLNGQHRLGVDNVVPENLRGRYEKKRNEFMENERIKIPSYSMKEMLSNRIY